MEALYVMHSRMLCHRHYGGRRTSPLRKWLGRLIHARSKAIGNRGLFGSGARLRLHISPIVGRTTRYELLEVRVRRSLQYPYLPMSTLIQIVQVNARHCIQACYEI